MPTYSTTTSSTSYPYRYLSVTKGAYGYHWTTSTTTDCSGFTWATHKEPEIEYLKHWIDSLKKPQIKEPQISEDDILKLIEGDE